MSHGKLLASVDNRSVNLKKEGKKKTTVDQIVTPTEGFIINVVIAL